MASVHRNVAGQPPTMPLNSEAVVCFILNYAEENGILLPGRIPGYKLDDIAFSTTRGELWGLYLSLS